MSFCALYSDTGNFITQVIQVMQNKCVDVLFKLLYSIFST